MIFHPLHKLIILLCLLITSTGCSFGGFENPEENNLSTVSTSEDETKMEIQSYPTSFRFDEEDYSRAWERAMLFFKMHAANNVKVSVRGNYKEITGSSSNLSFKVIANQLDRNSYKITVFSENMEGKTTSKSILNAKNVARFIDKGELDAGLLS